MFISKNIFFFPDVCKQNKEPLKMFEIFLSILIFNLLLYLKNDPYHGKYFAPSLYIGIVKFKDYSKLLKKIFPGMSSIRSCKTNMVLIRGGSKIRWSPLGWEGPQQCCTILSINWWLYSFVEGDFLLEVRQLPSSLGIPNNIIIIQL